LLADLAEIERLQALVQRSRITKCLASEKAKVENELQRIRKIEKTSPKSKVPTITINSYGKQL